MIRREFENPQMRDNEPIAKFSSQISTLINRLKSNGEDYDKQSIVEKILIIPQKYENLMMTIEEENDVTTLTMDELMRTLQTHEHQTNRLVTSSQEQSFKDEKNSRGKGKRKNDSGRGSRSRGH